MKNKFSKFINLQGKYLTSLLILLTLGIGNVWADDPAIASGELPSSTLNVSDMSGTLLAGGTVPHVIASGSTSSGNPYYVVSIDTIRQAYKSKASNLPWVYCKATDGGGSHTISLADGLSNADKLGFLTTVASAAGINSGRYHNYRVKNCNSVTILNRSNNTKDEKRIWLNIFKYNTTSEEFEFEEQIKSDYNSSNDIVVGATLSASDEYVIQITSGNTSNCKAIEIRFIGTPSCDDANASIIANTSVYVNDELDLEFSSDNTNSVVYDIKKGGSATSDASVTAGVFKATVAGTYVVTATQAKDASGHCAVEESVTITVNAKTPVASVSISGDATAFIGMAKTLTASADQAVSEYKWEVDGVDQGVNAATFNFSAAAAGTYSVVCKARNSFNDPGEYISSSAHSITVTKLCGELIRATRNGKNLDPVTGVVGGTAQKSTQDNGKLGSNGHYWKLVLASGIFMPGDTVNVNVSTAAGQGTLAITTDQAGANVIATAGGVGTTGVNKVVINKLAGNTIWLSRDGTNNTWNGVVDAIYVTRPCAASTDTTIYALTINDEAITPVNKEYSKEFSPADATTSVTVAYSVHPLASGSPASSFNIAVPASGDPANIQTITVTAEDGLNQETYTVSISRAADLSDNADLKALSVAGYTLDPVFAKATTAYTITKEYGAANPVVGDVTATPDDDNAKSVDVSISGNVITITVTAEDNSTTKEYTITINEAEAPKSLSRVLFSNGFDAFIDNTNHTVKAYYLAGTSAPTATTITAGAGTAGEYAEGKITVTGADASHVDYIVTLEAVTPNTSTVAEDDPAGEFAGDEAWVKNGLLIYGNPAGYSAGDKWFVNRRLTKSGDAADDQRVIAGWVRSYFFVGNASKFIMTVGGNKKLKYSVDGGEAVAVEPTTLEIALPDGGNHMIEIVSNQSSGDCRLSAPKLVELPPTFSVTYMPNGGSGAEYIIDDNASEVAAGTIFTAPASSIFAGWNTQADGNGVAYAAGDAVTENLTLHAQWQSYFTITYMDGVTELDTEDVLDGEAPVGIADPAKIGYDFAGWTLSGSDEVIDVTALSVSTTVYAKWIAFDGCTLFYPATSGSTIAVGDEIASQTGSFGATMVAVSKDESCTLAYESYGLSFASSGNTSRVKVTLANDIAVGTKITATIVANGNSGSNRALDLYNSAVAKKASLGWTSSDEYAKYDVGTFSYTVTSEDGMAGTNEFYLYRNNSVYLQCLKVETCGDEIVYHNVTSAVVPAGKGTVTLGASSVREGYTTTAEYSEIDPLYEFVNWTVSGAGASVADASANPATITVGTEDAVVTLNLQLIPVKFTVNYYDGETPMGTEEVSVNENPTASEIDTDKRHYTFQGWAETDGGSVVALNTITSDVAATISLYAVYAPVACPTEGTVFSMGFDPEKAPESTVKALRNGGVVELSEYATISGGDARIINNETGSDKDAITTSGQFKLTANGEVMKIELDCAIATGDVIRIPDNNAKCAISTSATKTGTYAEFGSKNVHEFEATAAWNGVDDLYILYDGSSLSFTQVYVLRPYTVSFDLQGHGDAIDALKLVAGKKVVAPTAPTADGWDFAGWYKEAACTNAWDFDSDVVEGNMSLFAKWTEHVTNDATLKSLKYGSTAIELEEGVYTYAVELAAAVASVPALSAETNAALATKVITNAEAFEAGQATSTVLVTAEDGETQLLYTVNFTKEAAIALQDVTGNMTWDFSKANDGSAATSDMCNEAVLANVAGIVNNDDFHSDNIMATANKFTSGKLQASMIKFHTTVSGSVIVKFANTGDKTEYRYLVVNGVQSEARSKNATTVTYAEYVPAGDVVLTVTTGNGGNMFNFTSVEFKLDNDLEPARTDEWLAPGEMGTICIPQGAVAVGADIYDLVGKEPQYGKVVFETVKHMKPGKPYMFIAKGTRIDLILTDETPATEPDNSGAMKGTFEQTYLTELENVYYFAGNALWGCADLVQLDVPANRAYVKLDEVEYIQSPEPAPGRRRVSLGVNGKGTATGIDAINASEKPMKLMIDGQMFILRGEKVFDATGRLVK